MEGRDEDFFNRASINVSQVHYDDEADRKLGSATALSTIIHPRNPLSPSIHMHVSYTELKQEKRSYWRIMADLNPSNPFTDDKDSFLAALEKVSGPHYKDGITQGDKYFYIPALERHRGVAHFYLEEYVGENFQSDREFAESVIKAAIDTYVDIVARSLDRVATDDDTAKKNQIDYHTLYLFQVLTLDRGTIFGLVVHDQNDVGIMGSLPSHIDRHLLHSWQGKMHDAQKPLLDVILKALPKAEDVSLVEVSEDIKRRLAANIRDFYKAHPKAMEHLAKADVVPTTTDNHLAPQQD